MNVLETVEEQRRQLGPIVSKMDGVLDDLLAAASRLNAQTAWLDETLHGAAEAVSDATDRMRGAVNRSVRPVVGFWRGLRAALHAAATSSPERRRRSIEARESAEPPVMRGGPY